MKAWLRQHAQALGMSLVRLLRQGSLLSVLVIGVALALPAGGYALLESLRPLGARLPLEPELSVFLQPQAARSEAEALAASLRADPRVSEVRFIPKDQALEELKEIEGVSEVVAALGRNPLPDAYAVRLRDPSAASLQAIASELEKLASVSHVQADALWAQRLAALGRILRAGLWLLSGLLGLALAAVTFNTIRLQILTRRDEIEVSKLLGASDAYIRRPYYYLGIFQGAAGALVALGVVAAGVALLNAEVAALADSYGSGFRLRHLGAGDAAALVGFAALLGWLGAHLSVARHLHDIEPR
jgi:cell division transport system permease protein